MSTTQKNTDNQEIDLTMISNKINGFFSGIGSLIYRSIQFFKRNLLTTVILFVSGVGLGIYMDSNNNTYDSIIIVRPNFGSTEYLYNKIDLLSSKIENRDTVFLKSIGIKDPKSMKGIRIEPIIDIYNLVNYNEKNVAVTTNILNFELLKLLAEEGDVNEVIKDKVTSRNYYWHTIYIVSNGFATNENNIKPILDYLNNNSYFDALKKVNLQNVKENIRKSEEMIFQIDEVLEKLATAKDQKADKLVFYNENTDLNGVLKTKQELVSKIGLQKEDLINFESVIKNYSSILNVKNTESVNGKLKFVLPLFFIFGFVFIRLFSKFYKRQALKHNKI